MENRLNLKMDERFVYSASGKPYRRRACRDRSELHLPRLPFVKQVIAKGRPYTYFKRGPGDRVRIPNIGELGFEHAYLAHLARMEGETPPAYEPPVRSCVYFIQPECGGPIKIGFARNVANRLAGMQTDNHEALVLLATARGTMKLERAYHVRFAGHRIRGEWFEPHADIIAEIERLNHPDRKGT